MTENKPSISLNSMYNVNEPNGIHPLLALIIIVAIVFFIRFFVKKFNGWNPLTIPIEKNVKEFPIPFTMTNDDVYYFGNGQYKLKLSRDGSLEIVRNSGFREWFTPREKKTKIGSVTATFDKDGITIKRNLYTLWKSKVKNNKTEATKIVFSDNGILHLVNQGGESIWKSHSKSIF